MRKRIYPAIIVLTLLFCPNLTAQKRASPKPKNSPVRNAIVKIHAAIVYRQGGPQPVARNKFYLLDKDLEVILKDAGVEPSKDLSIIALYGFSNLYPDGYAEIYEKSTKAIAPHIKSSVTTDFEGKAAFPSVPYGSYYLMGFTETRGGFTIWNIPVNVKGNSSIILDQNNAALAF